MSKSGPDFGVDPTANLSCMEPRNRNTLTHKVFKHDHHQITQQHATQAVPHVSSFFPTQTPCILPSPNNNHCIAPE